MTRGRRSGECGKSGEAAPLSHVDEHGAARMVDVSAKPVTARCAVAEALVSMRVATRRAIESGGVEKGGVLEVARIAGIQAAKRTSELIPLCHPLAIGQVAVEFAWVSPGAGASDSGSRDGGDEALLRVEATVKVSGRTGAEMEALTAVSIAALTVYDMVKAVDREVTIERIRLLEKTGGKSGAWRRA